MEKDLVVSSDEKLNVMLKRREKLPYFEVDGALEQAAE